MNFASIVQAGGKSRRLGKRKAIQSICCKSLIECVIERLTLLTSPLLIVTSREQQGRYQMESYHCPHYIFAPAKAERYMPMEN